MRRDCQMWCPQLLCVACRDQSICPWAAPTADRDTQLFENLGSTKHKHTASENRVWLQPPAVSMRKGCLTSGFRANLSGCHLMSADWWLSKAPLKNVRHWHSHPEKKTKHEMAKGNIHRKPVQTGL